MSGVMWQVAPEYKIQLGSCELSPKYFPGISALEYKRTIDAFIFCDSLWYVLFLMSYIFFQYVCMSFGVFCVPVNFLIQSVHSRKMCDEMILRSISEARIWFLSVTFSMLIIRVVWIEGWFLVALSLSLFLKSFHSWVWTSTVMEP